MANGFPDQDHPQEGRQCRGRRARLRSAQRRRRRHAHGAVRRKQLMAYARARPHRRQPHRARCGLCAARPLRRRDCRDLPGQVAQRARKRRRPRGGGPLQLRRAQRQAPRRALLHCHRGSRTAGSSSAASISTTSMRGTSSGRSAIALNIPYRAGPKPTESRFPSPIVRPCRISKWLRFVEVFRIARAVAIQPKRAKTPAGSSRRFIVRALRKLP